MANYWTSNGLIISMEIKFSDEDIMVLVHHCIYALYLLAHSSDLESVSVILMANMLSARV